MSITRAEYENWLKSITLPLPVSEDSINAVFNKKYKEIIGDRKVRIAAADWKDWKSLIETIVENVNKDFGGKVPEVYQSAQSFNDDNIFILSDKPMTDDELDIIVDIVFNQGADIADDVNLDDTDGHNGHGKRDA